MLCSKLTQQFGQNAKVISYVTLSVSTHGQQAFTPKLDTINMLRILFACLFHLVNLSPRQGTFSSLRQNIVHPNIEGSCE